jgi:mono/diheme cytochrome c family protein
MGHTRAWIVTLAACGIGLASPVRAEDEIDRVLAENGKARYEQYCTSCHGVGGAPGATAKTDLRTYVARHGGKFPAADWLAIIADARPGSVHTDVWDRVKREQGSSTSSSADVGARGIVGQIARYVNSIQSK